MFSSCQSPSKEIDIFADYLTKWLQVYAVSDQTDLTIARLFVNRFVSCHRMLRQLLSVSGPAFLSKLINEICRLLGVEKTNTTACHSQVDGLTERLNRTLLDTHSKYVVLGVQEWDIWLPPYVLFAYRCAPQSSTKVVSFYLLYGREPRLPTKTILSPPAHQEVVSLENYALSLQMAQAMSAAWEFEQCS